MTNENDNFDFVELHPSELGAVGGGLVSWGVAIFAAGVAGVRWYQQTRGDSRVTLTEPDAFGSSGGGGARGGDGFATLRLK
ncbi:MAG: hypothetical protein AAF822_10105 [Pseudomonadota bacterium]